MISSGSNQVDQAAERGRRAGRTSSAGSYNRRSLQLQIDLAKNHLRLDIGVVRYVGHQFTAGLCQPGLHLIGTVKQNIHGGVVQVTTARLPALVLRQRRYASGSELAEMWDRYRQGDSALRTRKFDEFTISITRIFY